MTAIAIASPAAAAPTSSSRAALWAGRVMTGLTAAFLLFDAGVKLAAPAWAIEGTTKLGYPASMVLTLGIVEAVCLALYLVPRTAAFGALVYTGYFGGAVATHARIGDPLFSHTLFPIYVATFMWGALWLRDARVRKLFS